MARAISASWSSIRCSSACSFPPPPSAWRLLPRRTGWGLFNLVALPAWVAVVAAVILLDLAIYLQHVLFHAVPALWRLHRMHHADLDFDVTTGVRFHPVEILLSMLIKLGVIAALGAPAVAVLIFEVLLNATSMFNHGNVRLPRRLDRVLRWLVVTPDMHRVHHSIVPRETNSNFGFNLPWWDRLFGTYRAAARGRPRRHDDRHRAIPRSARAPPRPHAAPAVPWRHRPLSARPRGSQPNEARAAPAAACCRAALIAGRHAWPRFNRDQLDLALLESSVGDPGPWAPLAYVRPLCRRDGSLRSRHDLRPWPAALCSARYGAASQPRRSDAWRDRSLSSLRVIIAADWVSAQGGGGLQAARSTGVEAEGWRFVAFVRLVPLFPFNLLNYALGLTRIPLDTVRARDAGLHGARHGRLYLARLRRAGGARRRTRRRSATV